MPYIFEYPNNPELLPSICENWKLSNTHISQRDDWRYFNGDNVTIAELSGIIGATRKLYWTATASLFLMVTDALKSSEADLL